VGAGRDATADRRPRAARQRRRIATGQVDRAFLGLAFRCRGQVARGRVGQFAGRPHDGAQARGGRRAAGPGPDRRPGDSAQGVSRGLSGAGRASVRTRVPAPIASAYRWIQPRGGVDSRPYYDGRIIPRICPCRLCPAHSVFLAAAWPWPPRLPCSPAAPRAWASACRSSPEYRSAWAWVPVVARTWASAPEWGRSAWAWGSTRTAGSGPAPVLASARASGAAPGSVPAWVSVP